MTDTSSKKLTPSAIGVAAFIIIIAGLKQAESFVNPLLMAFFISIILAQPVIWLKKKNVPVGIAIPIVIVGFLAFYTGLDLLVSSSLSLFVKDVQKYQDNIQELTDSAGSFFTNKGINITFLSGSGSLEPAKIMDYTRQVVGVIRELLSREVTFIFLTIFLMVELEVVGLKARVLAKGSESTLTFMNTIGKNIRHYLSIKTMTSLGTGILVGVSLALIGVDYPILWGLLAFLFNYIPTIGSIIAAIPGITFSILQLGFPATIWTIAVYVVANVVIGSVLEPKIMGKGLGLSTFVVFFSLIFWGFVLGPVGMFLSVPITMSIKIILENNPRTNWIAVMLGSKSDALAILEE